MAKVCEICGMKTEMPERHSKKYRQAHEDLLALRVEAEKRIEVAQEVKAEKPEGVLDRVRRMVRGD